MITSFLILDVGLLTSGVYCKDIGFFLMRTSAGQIQQIIAGLECKVSRYFFTPSMGICLESTDRYTPFFQPANLASFRRARSLVRSRPGIGMSF